MKYALSARRMECSFQRGMRTIEPQYYLGSVGYTGGWERIPKNIRRFIWSTLSPGGPDKRRLHRFGTVRRELRFTAHRAELVLREGQRKSRFHATNHSAYSH